MKPRVPAPWTMCPVVSRNRRLWGRSSAGTSTQWAIWASTMAMPRAVLDGRRPGGVVVGGDDDPLVGGAGQGADDVVGHDLVPAGVDVQAPGDRPGVEQPIQLGAASPRLSHRPLIGRAHAVVGHVVVAGVPRGIEHADPADGAGRHRRLGHLLEPGAEGEELDEVVELVLGVGATTSPAGRMKVCGQLAQRQPVSTAMAPVASSPSAKRTTRRLQAVGGRGVGEGQAAGASRPRPGRPSGQAVRVACSDCQWGSGTGSWRTSCSPRLPEAGLAPVGHGLVLRRTGPADAEGQDRLDPGHLRGRGRGSLQEVPGDLVDGGRADQGHRAADARRRAGSSTWSTPRSPAAPRP